MANPLFRSVTPQDVVRMSATVSPDNEAVSCLFDNLLVDLGVPASGLVEAAHYSWLINTGETESRPDVAVDVRFHITKSADSLARLVFVGCGGFQCEDFPTGTAVDEDRSFRVVCKCPTSWSAGPFVLTLALIAHRPSVTEHVFLQVDTVDIVRA